MWTAPQDLCYVNVKEAYTVSALPPLGKSDHNMVYLRPVYKPRVLTQPVTTRTFRKWTPEASESLRACFECTNWSVIQDSQDYNRSTDTDIDSMVECTTDYVNFCVDVALPLTTVKCFSNNKPWITADIKHLLNRKKRVYRDPKKRKEVQRDLKKSLRKAKLNYKRKLESRLKASNTRDVWRGMQTITGCKGKQSLPAGDRARANEFNLFYNRFNVPPSSTPIPAPPPPPPSPSSLSDHYFLSAPSVSPSLPSLTVDEVRAELRRLNPCKGPGPDGVSPRLLKDCAEQLALPLQTLFNCSLQSGGVPVLWKTSCLIPVPKQARATEIKNFRPVALTSHIMKTLERLVLRLLRPLVQHALDPLQFAYQEALGVEDAILYMLHRTYSFLDEPGGYVRIMFFDFSSAFDTILPDLVTAF